MSREQQKAEAEKIELFKRIDNATNPELGEIAKALTGEDPFLDPENRLLLPGVVRSQTIEALKFVINNDLVRVHKSKS